MPHTQETKAEEPQMAANNAKQLRELDTVGKQLKPAERLPGHVDLRGVMAKYVAKYMAITLAILAITYFAAQFRIMDAAYVGIFVTISVVLISIQLYFATPREVHSAVQELKKAEDIGAVNGLLDMLATNYAGARLPRVSKSLARLLPRLRSPDAGRLTPKQRATLRGLLDPAGYQHRPLVHAFTHKRDYYTALQPAVLSAMVHIGDERDLTAIERLAQGSLYPDIREKASACAEIVRARLQEQRPSRTLLRPASAPDAASTLLRPAVSTDTDDALLLRPSEGEAE